MQLLTRPPKPLLKGSKLKLVTELGKNHKKPGYCSNDKKMSEDTDINNKTVFSARTELQYRGLVKEVPAPLNHERGWDGRYVFYRLTDEGYQLYLSLLEDEADPIYPTTGVET